jgi:hypothetical protein
LAKQAGVYSVADGIGTELLRQIDFAAAGHVRDFLISGFSNPEATHTWAFGERSRLRLPLPSAKGWFIYILQFSPFGEGLNNVSIRMLPQEESVYEGRVAGDVFLGFVVNAYAQQGSFVVVDFHCTDFMSPKDAGLATDIRPLTVALKHGWIYQCMDDWSAFEACRKHSFVALPERGAAAHVKDQIGLDASDLVASFESLGHTCDFGLAQREVGAEPLGLLRFSGIENRNLIYGLMTQFRAIGLPENIRPCLAQHSGEFLIHEMKFGLFYHTFIPPTSISPEDLIARESRRLPFLARKFLEDVQNGEKIFILRRPQPMHFAEAVAIWAILNSYAKNSVLLLEQASARSDVMNAGCVFELGPRLLMGMLDGARGQIKPTLSSWLTLCANTLTAVRGLPLPLADNERT